MTRCYIKRFSNGVWVKAYPTLIGGDSPDRCLILDIETSWGAKGQYGMVGLQSILEKAEEATTPIKQKLSELERLGMEPEDAVVCSKPQPKDATYTPRLGDIFTPEGLDHKFVVKGIYHECKGGMTTELTLNIVPMS